MADDDTIEIDEFAMFQARSMGVETEYLEMAKAGRHQGRSSHNRRAEETSPGTSSGRRRGQRSSGGRQRSSKQSRGDEDTGAPYDSPNSPRTSDVAAARDWNNCRGNEDENPAQDNEEAEQNGDECQRPLHRSHSYRSKSPGGKPSWAEEDAEKPDEVFEQHEAGVEAPCDLKRTLTMPAKRHHRDRAPGKSSMDGSRGDSVRSWNRSRDPLHEENDNGIEDGGSRPTDFRSCSGVRGEAVPRTRRSENGEGDGGGAMGSDGARVGRGRPDEGRVGKSGVAWKDTVVCHNSSPVHDPGTTAGKRSSLLRHDSSGSCQLQPRNPQTPESGRRRTSNEITGDSGKTGGTGERLPPWNQNEASRAENGRDESGIRDPGTVGVRVATSRVERPPPGDEATVYKVLVLGSQGVGKSTVTRQLLAAGNGDDDDDESSEDQIVSVMVDDDESLLEFIDSHASQANRTTKQVADANLVVYSVTDRPSFAFAQSCLQELRPAKRHNVVILVANKQDLVRNRVISEEDGKNLAAKRHCKFIEVSALLSLKMDDLLVGIARQIRLRKGRANDGVGGQGPTTDRDTGRADAGGSDSGFGCLQRAALRAIHKVFRRRPVESTSCDNLCTP